MAESSKLDDKDKKEERPHMPPDDVRQLRAERDSLQHELDATKKKLREVESAHAQLEVAVKEYASKHGPLPKPREPQEGDSKCAAVSPHTKCEVCGWDYDTQTKPGMTGRQPHPV